MQCRSAAERPKAALADREEPWRGSGRLKGQWSDAQVFKIALEDIWFLRAENTVCEFTRKYLFQLRLRRNSEELREL
jgi:hypothetical protein